MQNYHLINNSINTFIKNHVQMGNLNGVILGLSGGIDSSVVAYCATQALGNKNILGLILPDKEITPQKDIDDALKICAILNLNYKIIYVHDIKDKFLEIVESTDNKLVKGNLISRIRMCILYYYANLLNRIVLGTSNKTEITIGYFTKFGDGGNDLSPIGDLYKTQVKEFAKFLNIPDNIINKKSSARLWENQQTEDELGLSFEDLDSILMFFNKSDTNESINLAYKYFPLISKEKISYILSLKKNNAHKIKFSSICNLN
jgi:NAD+ synthase